MPNNRTVTTREPLNLTAAPPDMHALFILEDGSKDYVPVFAFGVANVFEQFFDDQGRAQSAKKLAGTQLVGLALRPVVDEAPTSGHDMICEEISSFQGYVRRSAR